ncbi:anti-sigma factor [Flavobacteriaceae bacterium]|jgi:hypothetical protein|nr:RNA polymerase subunit sigma-70 [Flavobacteriaceae bacterium]MCP4801709.1 anti-sigma factor [Bacteroidota bacterium]MDA9552847.1 anti-sigma factor [Flavobacteriaceae bacterium]MDB2472071.1 anti-sigma factor [Flavobacteriaceae bacterium]MDC0957471.1 anti-sigma factor [Flavobacteriaceae bacterium]|tara:strand:- start:9190 stop:9987 length:798 start_codon:yes stop_codon:yes gene_type:complete
MTSRIQNFLKSGLLEKYVQGETTKQESHKVDDFINQHPEIKEKYLKLEAQLELEAQIHAVTPPEGVLESIFDVINKKSVSASKSTGSIIHSWLAIAASIIALVFAGTALMLYSHNKELLRENNTIVEEIFDLRKDIDENNNKLDDIVHAFNKLNNPETEKYVLRGNSRAKNLKTVAYINASDKSSLIDVVSLPELSDEQTYQMWANLQDKKINLGTLGTSNGKLQPVPYIEDVLSLSITIEPKDANEFETSENSVAEIPIKSREN